MKNSYFLFTMISLVLLISLLCWAISQLLPLHATLSTLFTFHFLSVLSSYFLLGIGFAIPLVILSSMLGLGQILLLLKGDINPHLGKDGFFNVIKTLFNKM